MIQLLRKLTFDLHLVLTSYSNNRPLYFQSRTTYYNKITETIALLALFAKQKLNIKINIIAFSFTYNTKLTVQRLLTSWRYELKWYLRWYDVKVHALGTEFDFFNKMNGETSFPGEVQVRGRGNILSYYRTSNDLPKK